MKKTLTVLVVLLTVSVFFCFPVSAATNMTQGVTRSTFRSVDGISVSVQAVSFYPQTDLNDEAVGTWQLMLTYNIFNVTDTNLQLASPKINISFSGYRDPNHIFTEVKYNSPVSIDSYGTDCFIGNDSAGSGYFNIVPSSDWVHMGRMCLPAGSRISGVSIVEFPATYSQVTGYINYLILDSIYIDITDVSVTDFVPNGSKQDILSGMEDILGALQGNNTTNTEVSTDSNTLKQQSDTVHQQEQAYYTANQQAIEATGLSNYNFSQTQGNGIQRVAIDFNNVWNSIGSFNSVYVFSLTLGLALTILRHAPNAISRINRRKQQ